MIERRELEKGINREEIYKLTRLNVLKLATPAYGLRVDVRLYGL